MNINDEIERQKSSGGNEKPPFDRKELDERQISPRISQPFSLPLAPLSLFQSFMQQLKHVDFQYALQTAGNKSSVLVYLHYSSCVFIGTCTVAFNLFKAFFVHFAEDFCRMCHFICEVNSHFLWNRYASREEGFRFNGLNSSFMYLYLIDWNLIVKCLNINIWEVLNAITRLRIAFVHF